MSLYEGDDWRDKAYYENWSFDEWKKNHGKDYFLVQEFPVACFDPFDAFRGGVECEVDFEHLFEVFEIDG